MVVAFGFTGVSTALTVMSDIEVLDTITWNWASAYTPSNGYSDGSNSNNGTDDQDKTVEVMSSTPSVAIVAGAVTGVLVVFVLIIVALYMFNYHQQKQKQKQSEMTQQQHRHYHQSPRCHQQHHHQPSHPCWITPPGSDPRDDPFIMTQHQYDFDGFTKDLGPTATSPSTSSSSPLSPTTYQSQQQQHIGCVPTRLYISTNPEIIAYPGTIEQRQHQQKFQQAHLPSPWTPITRQSFPPTSSEWMVRRAATAPHHFHRPYYLNKPDEPFTNAITKQQIRRAATTPRAALVTSNNNAASTSTTFSMNSASLKPESSQSDNEEEGDSLFDQQEFVLRSADVDYQTFPPTPTVVNNTNDVDDEEEQDLHSITVSHYEDNQDVITIDAYDSTNSSSSSSNRDHIQGKSHLN
ncbi:hypothetical protein BDA99DRAFT_16744 [Phascolomyces articulosus]|uniref:Uncharacterized protein n=1 Tax=Phascolomyces articulosus TaxID=60185 RepID=A0AAD5PL99_9FUNG|nr:hypothetical protein BDA99DRAFT_16744 [Phascolomyces articulosus]